MLAIGLGRNVDPALAIVGKRVRQRVHNEIRDHLRKRPGIAIQFDRRRDVGRDRNLAPPDLWSEAGDDLIDVSAEVEAATLFARLVYGDLL